MEVHAHTHPAPAGHRKKWTHYLWEFLMLFLAVFCGFLAENFREHQVEKSREKQYMRSMIQDLQSDTANLHTGFPLKEQRVTAIDSLLLFYETYPPEEKSIPYKIYLLLQRSKWDWIYQRYSRTNDQLKNAGGMRLIQNKEVSDSIARYDWQWQIAGYWKEAYQTNLQRLNDLSDRMYNARDLAFLYRKRDAPGLPSLNYDTLKIRIHPDVFNEYINALTHIRGTVMQDKRIYEGIEKRAERLMELIKKEYQME